MALRILRQFDRKRRETRMFVRALQSATHPILAQIVPIRRCNLDCAYCNEYDKTSAPVPLETMLRRIDLLADLGTTIITLSGGEPTLHPELDAIIHRIHGRVLAHIKKLAEAPHSQAMTVRRPGVG